MFSWRIQVWGFVVYLAVEQDSYPVQTLCEGVLPETASN